MGDKLKNKYRNLKSIIIPMEEKIDSLNVAVATSIILYEQYNNKK